MDQDMGFFGERVCFIGAHPDDIELGAGALIAHISRQTQIYCITLSDNQKNPDLINLVSEHYQSMAVLGVPENNVTLGSFDTRRFPQARQEILEYLIAFNKNIKPDIVFTHTKADIHQDHNTVTEEALRAFRGTTVLGFDVLRSSYGFFPNFLVGVDELDVNLKIQALSLYKTYDSKYYFDPQITHATLVRNGGLCQRPFAEAFDILRVIATFEKPIKS
jgi:N-acetylglucosamine malate deacetylase 1